MKTAISSSNKIAMSKENEKSNKIRKHRCVWGHECMLLHKRFAATDDPRGKDPIRLNLTGPSETMVTWKKVVIKLENQ